MNKQEAIDYVKTGIGGPIIEGFEISDKDIEVIAYNKSLLEFFKRYPLEVNKDYPRGSIIRKEDYPGKDKCLGILTFNFTSASEFVDPSIDDPFGLSRRLIDLNIDHAMPGILAQRASIMSLRRPSFSLVKDDITGDIKLSSMYDGFFRIKWGVLGEVEQIPLVRLYEVLDLSVAMLQIYIGTSRSLLKLPGTLQFETDKLVSNAEAKRKEILAKWIVIPMQMIWR